MSSTPENHEVPVLARVAAGEEGAVRLCMDRFGGLVWTLARRLCPTRVDAEDAVQEIFVAVWKSAHRYDPSLGSEATFIATIARRRLIDRARRRGRQPGTQGIIENQASAEVEQPASIGHKAELSEDAKRAEAALEELSPDQQRVLRLSLLYGLSHDKIATSTGMPLGTVKTHIRRGLIKVREKLGSGAAPSPERSRGPLPRHGEVTP